MKELSRQGRQDTGCRQGRQNTGCRQGPWDGKTRPAVVNHGHTVTLKTVPATFQLSGFKVGSKKNLGIQLNPSFPTEKKYNTHRHIHTDTFAGLWFHFPELDVSRKRALPHLHYPRPPPAQAAPCLVLSFAFVWVPLRGWGHSHTSVFCFPLRVLASFTNKGIKSALWENYIKNNEAEKENLLLFQWIQKLEALLRWAICPLS